MDTIAGTRTPTLTQRMMPTTEQIDRARGRLHRKAAFIAVLAVGSYSALVFAPVGLMLRVVLALVLVVALVAVATGIMHDANHGAFSTSKRLTVSPDGAPICWEQARSCGGTSRGLYGFLTLQWFVMSDYSTLLRGKQGSHPLPTKPRPRDIAMILLGKVVHLGWAIVLPMFFHPWWGVLSFYMVSSWLVGFLLANIFQLAHCVDRAEFFTTDAPRRGADFELHQLRTTVDIRCRVPIVAGFVHWLMGGLDYQVEHHLAPKLPHTIYPQIAPRLEAACVARGVTYRTHSSVIEAVRSHSRWLRTMGRPPLGNP